MACAFIISFVVFQEILKFFLRLEYAGVLSLVPKVSLEHDNCGSSCFENESGAETEFLVLSIPKLEF